MLVALCLFAFASTQGPAMEHEQHRVTTWCGSGMHLNAQVSAVIASVDARLREILASDLEGEMAFLAQGQAWKSLNTSHSQGSGRRHGTRHDHMVALLCGVGVAAVQSSRQRFAAARVHDAKLPPEPAQRGAKRGNSCLDAGSTPPLDGPDSDQEAEALKPIGYRTLAGVPGQYVQISERNAEAHAVALVLGRLYTICSLNNISDQTCQTLMGLLHSCGVKVGQKHHSRSSISAFQGILSRLCVSTIRNRFKQPPRNLLFPSAWRLIFDGITLNNGATVTVVLVAYTSQDGDIMVDFLGCAHGGASSVGWEQARSVYSMLDRVLNVADATATCRGSVGLPLEPLASSRGQAAVRRGMFLACIPCDRAYCGKTGIGADAHLSEMLGCQGILGTHRRVGMADLFHCYDGCAKATWNTTRKSCHASSQGQGQHLRLRLRRRVFRLRLLIRWRSRRLRFPLLDGIVPSTPPPLGARPWQPPLGPGVQALWHPGPSESLRDRHHKNGRVLLQVYQAELRAFRCTLPRRMGLPRFHEGLSEAEAQGEGALHKESWKVAAPW